MEVYLNNEAHTIEINATIKQFLSFIKIEETKGIAIAVNNTVISKDKWQTHILNNQDKIIIITATQGG